jgi:cytochrome c-type biogenesis protein CcmH
MNEPNLSALREQWHALLAQHHGGALDEGAYAKARALLEQQILAAALAPAEEPACAVEAAPTTAAAASMAAVTSTASAEAATPVTTPAMPPMPTGRTRVPGRVWASASVFILVLAAVGYGWKGSPRAVGTPPPGFEQAGSGGADASGAGPRAGAEQVETVIKQLQERLAQQPGDAEGWALLARSQMALGRYAEASAAYEKLRALKPDDPAALTDHADALGVLNGRTLEGEPAKLLARALQLDPKHIKALVLVGTLEYQRGNFAGAERQWAEAVRVGPAGDQLVELAREGVAQAQARQRSAAASSPATAGAASAAARPGPTVAAAAAAGATTTTSGSAAKPAATAAASAAAPAPTSASTASTTPSAAAASIRGTVRLSEALKAQAAPGDTVFIFARAAAGSPMPLAILKKTVAELPATFALDDSLAMSPGARLSTAERVVVVARISKTGQAMPQPGDLEGLSAEVAPGARDLVIEIANVRR